MNEDEITAARPKRAPAGSPADPSHTTDLFAGSLPPPGPDPLRTRVTGSAPDPIADVARFFDPPLRLGSLGRLGHYELIETLGHGGFGVVFRAFDDVLQRPVALKVLNPALVADPAARVRFLREARAAAPIRHENVVQVFAIAAEPVPHIVMEYVPGTTLEGLIERTGPLAPDEVRRIGAQIARGLSAAHALGLVHRDVKPANVLLEDEGGRVKVGDFGLARTEDDAAMTQSGLVAGTPMFMSPEQARGEPLDPRSDLFSLGSVLYAMCTGRPPFQAPTSLAVLRRITDEEPAPIRRAAPGTPMWLCQVINRLLAKSPADRYQSAAEVADALTNPPAAAPAEPPARAPQKFELVKEPEDPADEPDDEPEPAPRKSRVLVLALVGVVLLGALGTGGYLLTRPSPQAGAGTEAKRDPGPPPLPELPKPELPKPELPFPKLPPPPFPPLPVPASAPTGEAYTNALGMKLVRVPKGTGWLGGGGGSVGAREIGVAEDFYLGAFEVMQTEWVAVVGTNPSRFAPDGSFGARLKGLSEADLKRLPLDSVSWEQGRSFLARLNEAHPVSGWEYRLPTKDEWEYACRGGPVAKADSAFDYYFTAPTNKIGSGANMKGHGPHHPRPVGSYAPNRLGLHDMHGNVAELCHDLKEQDGEQLAVVRGGSCLDDTDTGRAAAPANLVGPKDAFDAVGLRVALVRKK
ncbi:MAG TPA: bifunctional serine/threonine-protein kinase/formylglycine-generating enzyme family protein [Gemmata sp.]